MVDCKDLADLLHSLTTELSVFVNRLRRMNGYPHRLLVITAALSEVKSRQTCIGDSPSRVTQSLIAALAGLQVPFLCISMVGGEVHLPPVLFQPMAADDVASAVGKIAVGQPLNGIVEIGGPEQFRLDALVQRRLATLNDPREVIADPNALYSGAKISEKTLVPGNSARLGETTFESWLTQSARPIQAAGSSAA